MNTMPTTRSGRATRIRQLRRRLGRPAPNHARTAKLTAQEAADARPRLAHDLQDAGRRASFTMNVALSSWIRNGRRGPLPGTRTKARKAHRRAAAKFTALQRAFEALTRGLPTSRTLTGTFYCSENPPLTLKPGVPAYLRTDLSTADPMPTI